MRVTFAMPSAKNPPPPRGWAETEGEGDADNTEGEELDAVLPSGEITASSHTHSNRSNAVATS